ncbi:LacI family DNA-binding transcriptional regulator [Maritimibacter fusiformis]|uniref:LacI family DNA-binding transcriptional regulator n=1 Tax=Maritimibacter fusiformis TaxID=2603819 RepID=A0A5D0RJ65_9RHOB|nr:LacI family DNA-binding transcriptional regulator [Maritimibacter fusiformis]TYB81149.1 LacI family DNA-binding transcriptional regulator [Maritimibacter fusiformis]
MSTIYDVAKAAQVSPKTVSRVLNGDAPVGKKTREAVEKAIAELGYVPSSAARTMRSQRSGLIGLVTGAISLSPLDPAASGLPDIFIVKGVQEGLENSGKTLLISDTGGRSDRVPSLMRTFVEHRVEGIIYVADYHRQVSLPRLPGHPPIVLANCYDDAHTPAIVPDDRFGQYRLVQEIIAHGHRRIAYLTLSDQLDATRLRTAGYRAALQDAGIDYDPALVVVADTLGDDTEAQAECLWAALDAVLALDDRPTVICCGNDRMAMRAYGMLRARQIEVPADIAVAGYDDYRAISDSLFPRLTTVELPYVEMGRRAAERLLAAMAGADTEDAAPELIRGDVVWRASVPALVTGPS